MDPLIAVAIITAIPAIIAAVLSYMGRKDMRTGNGRKLGEMVYDLRNEQLAIVERQQTDRETAFQSERRNEAARREIANVSKTVAKNEERVARERPIWLQDRIDQAAFRERVEAKLDAA